MSKPVSLIAESMGMARDPARSALATRVLERREPVTATLTQLIEVSQRLAKNEALLVALHAAHLVILQVAHYLVTNPDKSFQVRQPVFDGESIRLKDAVNKLTPTDWLDLTQQWLTDGPDAWQARFPALSRSATVARFFNTQVRREYENLIRQEIAVPLDKTLEP